MLKSLSGLTVVSFVVLLSVGLAVVALTPAVGATPIVSPLTIDGSGGCAAGSAASCPITFSTSNPNDVIYVFESGASDTPATPTSTPVAFSLRAGVAGGFEAPGGAYMSSYSATWSSSGSITITCNWSPTYNGNACIAFAVSGSSGIFDPNAAVPCTSGGTSTTSSCTTSTSNANDMILGCALSEGSTTFTPSSGFTVIDTVTQGYAFNISCEEQVVSTTQSSLGVGYSFGSSYNWGQFADALVAAETTSNSTPSSGPYNACEVGIQCYTTFAAFDVTQSGAPVGGATVVLSANGYLTQNATTSSVASTSALCTLSPALTSQFGAYWGCLAGETGQFTLTAGVTYSYTVTLPSGTILTGSLGPSTTPGTSAWSVTIVDVSA